MKHNVKSSHRKDKGFRSAWTAYHIKEGKATYLMEVRTYSTSRRYYACLWVNIPKHIQVIDPSTGIRANGLSGSGSGYAGGYGYNKEGAAIGEALASAIGGYEWINKNVSTEANTQTFVKDFCFAIGLNPEEVLVNYSHP